MAEPLLSPDDSTALAAPPSLSAMMSPRPPPAPGGSAARTPSGGHSAPTPTQLGEPTPPQRSVSDRDLPPSLPMTRQPSWSAGVPLVRQPSSAGPPVDLAPAVAASAGNALDLPRILKHSFATPQGATGTLAISYPIEPPAGLRRGLEIPDEVWDAAAENLVEVRFKRKLDGSVSATSSQTASPGRAPPRPSLGRRTTSTSALALAGGAAAPAGAGGAIGREALSRGALSPERPRSLASRCGSVADLEMLSPTAGAPAQEPAPSMGRRKLSVDRGLAELETSGDVTFGDLTSLGKGTFGGIRIAIQSPKRGADSDDDGASASAPDAAPLVAAAGAPAPCARLSRLGQLRRERSSASLPSLASQSEGLSAKSNASISDMLGM